MAGIALVAAANMVGALTTGQGAIMTTDTGTNHLRVVNGVCRNGNPWRGTRGMTGIALLRAINMTRSFATGNDSVMTTGAGANHLPMIDCGVGNWHPGGRQFFVAGFTEIVSVNMCRTFATGSNTIVAANAVVYDWPVIHGSRYPRTYAMAGITFRGGSDMCWTLTSRNHIVMATATYANDFIVIHGGGCNRYPRCGYMAGFTQISGVDVRGVLTGSLQAIVTGDTGLADYRVVIKTH